MSSKGREEYARIRRPALERMGLAPAVVDYLLDLERLDPPAAASSLAELADSPRWEGKRAVLAGSGRELVYRGGRWTVA